MSIIWICFILPQHHLCFPFHRDHWQSMLLFLFIHHDIGMQIVLLGSKKEKDWDGYWFNATRSNGVSDNSKKPGTRFGKDSLELRHTSLFKHIIIKKRKRWTTLSPEQKISIKVSADYGSYDSIWQMTIMMLLMENRWLNQEKNSYFYCHLSSAPVCNSVIQSRGSLSDRFPFWSSLAWKF